MTCPGGRRFWVDGPAGRISALEWWGDQAAVPTLFLHPVNTAAAVWTEVAAGLPAPSAAVDFRGHGRSDPAGPYLPLDFAADAHAVLDRLGWEQFHLVAGSIGGAVAAELVAQAPGRIASVALLGATFHIGEPAAAVATRTDRLRALGVRDSFRAHGRETIGPAAGTDSIEKFVELSSGRDVEVVSEIIRATFAEADSRTVAANMPRLPALVVVGSHDRTCPYPMADEIARLLGTEAVVLDGVGHLPMLEAPVDVVALLKPLHEQSEHK